MSANVTQMPLIPEFVRVFFTHDLSGVDGDVEVTGLAVHPMRQFTAPTEEVNELLVVVFAEGLKLFREGQTSRAVAYVNHAVNAGLGELDTLGKIRYVENTMEMYGDLQYIFEGVAQVRTVDGYSVFNPARIPPSPSGHYH